MTSLEPAERRDLLAFAHQLADAARAAILPLFRSDLAVDSKPGRAFDPVTEADRAAERAMRAMIEAQYPDHGVLGEEYGLKVGQSAWSWSLDPIDGTRAFMCGLPTWGTLIALRWEGRPVIGIIDQGFLDERYVGEPDGAYLITRGARFPLRTRPCPRLSDSVLMTTDAALFDGAEAGGFEMIRRTARLTRYGCDCYAYAMLAAGRVDIVIESGLKDWDVNALAPVVLGAGGVMTDWAGRPAFGAGRIVAAGDARLLDEAIPVLARCLS